MKPVLKAIKYFSVIDLMYIQSGTIRLERESNILFHNYVYVSIYASIYLLVYYPPALFTDSLFLNMPTC